MTQTIESISIQQARKLVLLSQKIPPIKPKENTLQATLVAIENLGYIQIDTISAIQRAHHHTLWNRNPEYKITHLDELIEQKKVFEYWSHAAAYLPINDYRYTLPRKKAIANGEQNHWYQKDKKMMESVLKRIKDEGPLMAKDFTHNEEKSGEWGSRPSKQALEYLFMQGALMIPYRVNFHKVYDITERVLPAGIDTTIPTKEEYARFLITRYLQANGLGLASEMVYLLKNTKPIVTTILAEMLNSGELIQIKLKEKIYFAFPRSLELLNNPLAKSKLKILSPFDNFLIQRKRTKELFDFDYLLECYVPESKRKFGYFALPILWDGKLVARMDCKADRKTSTMHIHHIALEPKLSKLEAFALALSKELSVFLKFNECKSLYLHKTSPTKFKTIMDRLIKDII